MRGIAQRYGFDQGLVDFGRGAIVPYSELLEEILALVVFPNTGHAVNLEEPDLFNRTCADFFHQVESGRWPRRDPRSVTGSILGVR